MGDGASKHYHHSMNPYLLVSDSKIGDSIEKSLYNSPQAHAVSFFLGMCFGYISALHNDRVFKLLNLKRVFCGTILVLSTNLHSYYVYSWYAHESRSRLISTILFFTAQLVYVIHILWLILIYQHGFGGWMNQILSCRLFILLGKSSYMAYLNQFVVITVSWDFCYKLKYVSDPSVSVIVIIGNLIVVNISAFVLHIVYEMPWLRVQKLLLPFINKNYG